MEPASAKPARDAKSSGAPLSAAAPSERRGFLSPLRVRLSLLVLLAWLPVVALVIASSFSDRAKAAAAAKEDLLRTVHTVARRQQEYIDSTRQLLRALARWRFLVPENADRAREQFTEILSLQKTYADIGAIDHEGRVFASGRPDMTGRNLAERAFFREAMKRKKFVDGDYHLDRATGKAVLWLAHPVTNHAGAIRGLVYAALNLDWIYQFAPQVDLLENSHLMVFNRTGTLLLQYPDSDQVQADGSRTNMTGLVQFLMEDNEGSGLGGSRTQNRMAYAYAALSSTGGFADAWAVASIPAATVFSGAHLVLMQNLTFLGFVGALALGAAWFGGDVLVLQPVNTLAQATHSIRGGNFKVRPDIKHAPAELAELAEDFSAMARSLEERIAERERAEAELRQLNEELEQRVAARTQDLKRSNEELEQFAYVASHDLQEPLRMVISYMQLLQQRYQDKLDANAGDFIEFAVEGSRQMQRLINDLLSYSRVGTRQRPLEPTDMERVLERTLTNLKVALEESEAVITHDPLPVVLGDATQLGQLLQNLIGNAIKFRGSHACRVNVSARRRESCGGAGRETAPLWEFAIQDNGIGIAPGDYERIFVIFQRLHSRGKYSGTGIGLAICKKIVERHGGCIWPESELGKGARLCFTLPGVRAA